MSTLQFCAECNNILSPKADPVRRVLVLFCRSCHSEENAENRTVFRNDLLTDTRERPGITQDLMHDPTLPHATIPCPQCGNMEAVFYQDQSKRKETRMILFYVCTNPTCQHVFFDQQLKTVGELDV